MRRFRRHSHRNKLAWQIGRRECDLVEIALRNRIRGFMDSGGSAGRLHIGHDAYIRLEEYLHRIHGHAPCHEFNQHRFMGMSVDIDYENNERIEVS